MTEWGLPGAETSDAPAPAPFFGGTVVRVQTDEWGSSHVEPAINQDWTDLDKLQWHAAVVAIDVTVPVRVTDGGYEVRERGRWKRLPGFYTVHVGTNGWSSGPYRYSEAWTYLNGVTAGALAVRTSEGAPE